MMLFELLMDMFDEEIEDDYINNNGIRGVEARDVYGDLSGTAYFKHWCGLSPQLFEYIAHHINYELSTPRNIYFRYSEEENRGRIRRRCKITNNNRLINFLHTMNENSKIWDQAATHGWNISSVSQDFKHVLMAFTKTFGNFIRILSDEQKIMNQGLFTCSDTAYQILDGSMYRRRKTCNLKDGIARRDYYDWKRNWPESVKYIYTLLQLLHHQYLL